MLRVTAATPGDVNLRPATAGDRSRVGSLLEESRLPLAGISESLDGFFVAERGAHIIGAIGLERYGDYGLLRSAAVSESARGEGVGRALVERVIEAARGAGLAGVYLLTTTAEGYFPSFGFTRVSREAVAAPVTQSVEFADACPASAAVFYLPLA